MQKIVLDVIPSGIQPRVYVDQYDLGRQFQITFKEGMGDYAFAPGTIIKINGRKSDGHVFEYTESSKWDATHYVISKSGSGSSTVVTISTTEQMTAAAGDADVQLTLQNSAGAVIGTLNFIMVVQMRPSAAGDPSESDLPDIVRSVNNILPDADGNVQISPVGDGIGASNISTVEPTRTMRTAYSAGDYVYVTADDQLYRVTSPIGANGTLTPGTNAVACVLTSDLVDYHSSNLTFNSVGKYIFDGDIKCLSARVVGTGNYAIIVGNNNSNTVFMLYNTESTSFDRVTTQPTLNVEWWTQP